jgi:hypothetical protein
MAYTNEQFAVAYTALVQMYQGLRHVDIDEVIRHVRHHNGHQFDEAGLASTNKLMEVLESTRALRETMKRVGVPAMPKMMPQGTAPSTPMRGQTGHG